MAPKTRNHASGHILAAPRVALIGGRMCAFRMLKSLVIHQNECILEHCFRLAGYLLYWDRIIIVNIIIIIMIQCMEQFAVIRQECAFTDVVPSWSEDCTFSVVVRSSLGDRNCTIYCNYCLTAATGYQPFCLFFLFFAS